MRLGDSPTPSLRHYSTDRSTLYRSVADIAFFSVVVSFTADTGAFNHYITAPSSVHQAAKLVAVLLRVVRVTAGLEESSGILPPGL